MGERGYSEAEHLEALNRGMAKSARELFADREDLVPILAPAAFVAKDVWVGPFERLAAPGVILVWATLGPLDTMIYLNHEVAGVFEEENIDFKALAIRNLRRMTTNDWTYEFKRESGEIWGVGLMHPDACGPSRLLLADVWQKLFPSGYLLAAPESSCALVFSKDLDAVESSKVAEIVAGCYRGGTRPLAPDQFEQWQLAPPPA